MKDLFLGIGLALSLFALVFLLFYLGWGFFSPDYGLVPGPLGSFKVVKVKGR